MTARPALKSAVVAADCALEITKTRASSWGSVGLAPFVRKRSVCGSILTVSTIDRVKVPKEAGELGTAGTRASVAITSSASKAVPSWKRTPRRKTNSHVVSSMLRQDVARAGCASSFSSR